MLKSNYWEHGRARAYSREAVVSNEAKTKALRCYVGNGQGNEGMDALANE